MIVRSLRPPSGEVAASRARRWPRALAAVASLSLVATAWGVLPAQAVAEDPDTRDAAGFLGRQLQENNYRLPGAGAGSTDWGLTIDAVFALSAAGVGKDVVDRTVDSILSSDFTYLASQNAENMGAFAKTALALQVAGRAPVTADGTDLEALVRSKVDETGKVGRNSNHFGQALSVLSLARTTAGVPQNVVDFTVGYQCRDTSSPNYGGFGFSSGTAACRSVDGDATGMLGSALLAVRGQVDPSVFEAAVTWLASKQLDNGSFVTGWSGAGNTNSAGLASQFARETGTAPGVAVADKADAYLSSLMVGCTRPVNFTATSIDTGGGFWTQWRGAIAYDAAGMDRAVTGGVATNYADQWRRASAQAVLGMSGVVGFSQMTTQGSEAGLPDPSECALVVGAPSVSGESEIGSVLSAAPTTFSSGNTVHTGVPALAWQWLRDGAPISGATSPTYTVTAADAGEPLAVRVTVVELGWTGSATSATQVGGELPAGTFAVTATQGRVAHGAATSVLATGLAARETYTVRLGGVVVGNGRADDAGEVRTSVVVPRGTRTERARALSVTGRNASRSGATSLWVIGPATIRVSVPTRPVHRGKRVAVRATGLQPQEAWTLTVSGVRLAAGRADASGAVAVSATVPSAWKSVRNRPVVLTGEAGDRVGRAQISTTAPKKLSVKASSKSVKAGKSLKVTVSGLMPGEKVSVKAGKAKATSGYATNNGRFSVRIKAGSKRGKVTVKATGVSGERSGRTTYRVR